ncbi:hypothetical protein RUM44_006749 [Polyplax serrata]|uniref:Protein kinase domain-containing protein n=1 Tax=Polyplax serrata TaxID=468196 RepID=A0ABR1AJ13_POLSC
MEDRGVFASVRKCQSLETGVCYAAKFTNRDRYGEDCSTEIYHEIALLSLCGSAPRVIQIHDVFETVNEIIIVMHAPGGDLQTIIDEDLVPFESDVKSFIRQTVEGLDYLHRRRIAHLDIKPQNIVMMGDYPNCEIKLCDFEISRVILEGKDVRELLGTPDYVAPEILHYEPITLAADMWSLGVTTYVLLTGFSPFGGETDQETFCNISRGDVDFPDDLFKDVSNDAIDFVKRLLVKNPEARLTAADCLKHAWLDSQHSKKPPEVAKPILTVSDVSETNSEDIRTAEDGDRTPNNEVDESGRDDLCDATLRKYLSKSRESLFDRVVQKHNKRNTIKNNRFRKTRMCKSQMSLISKSQEKLLAGEILNAPSRSIEKLYGLRSLSKSQEVLSLYKSGGILASQENLNRVSEMIKSKENVFVNNGDGDPNRYRKLMRATTADLGVLQQRNKPCRMYSYSSTTSLSSFTVNTPEDEVGEDDDERQYIIRRDSVFDGCSSPAGVEDGVYPSQAKPQGSERREETNSVMKEIEELENRRKMRKNINNYGDDEDEPRFTVAQLITAFNKHQEIVTKTSLEVTMSSHVKNSKIPPIIPYESKSTFPTGPTALRLFIPDIDLVSMPKKYSSKYKTRVHEHAAPVKDKTPPCRALEEHRNIRVSTSNSDCSNLSLNSIISSNTYGSTYDEPFHGTVNGRKEPSRRKSETVQKYNQDSEKTCKSSGPGTQRRSKSSSPGVENGKTETYRTICQENHERRDRHQERQEDTLKKRSPTPSRRVGGNNRSVERSPSVTRKSMTVERSPGRKGCSRSSTRSEESSHRKPQEPSSHYKIVGIGEKNTSRKSSGVSYKIEFDSPVVKRKFPLQNMTIKGTISSNLKVRETVNRARK